MVWIKGKKGTACCAPPALVGRKFALLLFAPPSLPFPVLRRPLLSFLRNLSSEFSIFAFPSFSSSGCFFSSGWTRRERAGGGWLARTNNETHTCRVLQSATTCCCSVMRAWNEDGRKQGQMRRNGMLYRSKSRGGASIWAPLA